MRRGSREAHPARLPAHADASGVLAGGLFDPGVRRLGPERGKAPWKRLHLSTRKVHSWMALFGAHSTARGDDGGLQGPSCPDKIPGGNLIHEAKILIFKAVRGYPGMILLSSQGLMTTAESVSVRLFGKTPSSWATAVGVGSWPVWKRLPDSLLIPYLAPSRFALCGPVRVFITTPLTSSTYCNFRAYGINQNIECS